MPMWYRLRYRWAAARCSGQRWLAWAGEQPWCRLLQQFPVEVRFLVWVAEIAARAWVVPWMPAHWPRHRAIMAAAVQAPASSYPISPDRRSACQAMLAQALS